MGDIYSSESESRWRAEEQMARDAKAFRDYERRREYEDSHQQDKADWNKMESDIERLTKERDEARQIVAYIRDALICNDYAKCKRCELTAIIGRWNDE